MAFGAGSEAARIQNEGVNPVSAINKNFQPQEVVIDGETHIAKTPNELADLTRRQKEAQNRVDMANQGKNPDGSPYRPEWDSMLNADGMIDSKYQMYNSTGDMLGDDLSYQKIAQEALRDGPSKFTDLMLQKRDMDRQDQIGDISTQYQMGLQNAMDSMASQGGMMTGARERMGANSIRDLLSARQGARRDYNKDKLSLLASDEQQRLSNLQNFGNLEMDRNRMMLQAREFDVTNSLKERDSRRAADMDKWRTEMESWASNKQADAQAKAAGGGCFPKNTLVDMADGTKKPIDKIEIGDICESGGEVTKILVGSAEGADWYEYEGVIVTADHAVFDNEKWIRVKDADDALPVDFEFDRLYNLANENHEIVIKGVVFSDFDEVDDQRLSDEECLVLKNKGVYV